MPRIDATTTTPIHTPPPLATAKSEPPECPTSGPLPAECTFEVAQPDDPYFGAPLPTLDDVQDLSLTDQLTLVRSFGSDADRAMAELDPLLRNGGLRRISHGDVARTLRTLDDLAPADRAEVLERLQASGDLAALTERLDAGELRSLVSMAEEAGLVDTTGGVAHPGTASPPRSPVYAIPNDDTPPALRRALREHNLNQIAQYEADYDAYIGRYQDAVESTQSIDEIRALGRPQHMSLSLPDDPLLRARYDASDYHGRDTNEAWHSIRDHHLRLIGQPLPGSFSFRAEVTVTSGDTDATFAADSRRGQSGIEVAQGLGPITVSSDTDGQLTAGARLGTDANHVRGEMNADGEWTGGARVSGGGYRVDAEVNSDGEWSGQVRAPTLRQPGVNENPLRTSVGLDSDGTLHLDQEFARLGIDGLGASASYGGSVNPDGSEIEYRVGGQAELGNRSVEAEVSVSFLGVDRETAGAVMGNGLDM